MSKAKSIVKCPKASVKCYTFNIYKWIGWNYHSYYPNV